jgi:hypothetical protein
MPRSADTRIMSSSTSVTLRTLRTGHPQTAEPAGQHVEGVVGEGVAEVAAVIGGDAADVEAHPGAAAGERLERPGGGIEEADHGCSIATGLTPLAGTRAIGWRRRRVRLREPAAPWCSLA